MNNIPECRNLSVQAVCAAAAADPRALIHKEETRYRNEIAAVAASIHNSRENHHIVLLSGPSSSGKTTTASLLCAALEKCGTACHVVSLDNFYLGAGKAPLLPDGRRDYESIEALDVERLLRCLREIVELGKTELPVFDFPNHRPSTQTSPLLLEPDAAIIFEGIHAFNPRLQTYLPPEMTIRLFINTLSRFHWNESTWFARRDLRLIRRILRDEQFRGSPFSNTMSMWPQVINGEKNYLFPFADTADCVIDTTFAYEPCIFADRVLPLLRAVPDTDPDVAIAHRLIDRLSVFPALPLEFLPAGAMLREFTG